MSRLRSAGQRRSTTFSEDDAPPPPVPGSGQQRRSRPSITVPIPVGSGMSVSPNANARRRASSRSNSLSVTARTRTESLAQIGTGFTVEARLEDPGPLTSSSNDERATSRRRTSSAVGIFTPSDSGDPFEHFAENPYRGGAKFKGGDGDQLSRRLTSIQHNVDAILTAYDESIEGQNDSDRNAQAVADAQFSGVGAGLSYQVEELIREREVMRQQIHDLRGKLAQAASRKQSAQQTRRATITSLMTTQSSTKSTQTHDDALENEPSTLSPSSLLHQFRASVPDAIDLKPAPSFQENLNRLRRARMGTVPPPPSSTPLHGTFTLIRIDVENSIFNNLLYYLPGDVMPAVMEMYMGIRRLAESLSASEMRDEDTLHMTLLIPKTTKALAIVEFMNDVHSACLRIDWHERILEDPDARVRFAGVSSDVLWKGIPVSIAAVPSRVTMDYDARPGEARSYHIADRPILERLSRIARPGETLTTTSYYDTIASAIDPALVCAQVLIKDGGPKGEGLVQLLPTALSSRTFTAMNSDVWGDGVKVEDAAVASGAAGGGAGGAAGDVALAAAEPRGHVTLVCVDIPHSERLWAEEFVGMQLAMKQFHALVRKHGRLHRGFEMRSTEDGFFFAFPSENNAIVFAVEVQLDLQHSHWPDTLLRHPLCETERDGQGNAYFLGLRVRAGIHSGRALSLPNPDSGAMDYWGPPVALAAKLCSAAQGGQIIVSDACFSKSASQVPMSCTALPPLRLPGMTAPVKVLEVYPAKLSRRRLNIDQNVTPSKSCWDTSVYTDPKKVQAAITILQHASVLHGRAGLGAGDVGADPAALRRMSDPPPGGDHDAVVVPPTRKVTLAMVEVDGVDALWDRNYDATVDALSTYNTCVRKAVAAHNGYVVSGDNDVYMVAFEDDEVAMDFALDVQVKLVQADWPSDILKMTREETTKKGDPLFRGLRAAVALTTGKPLCLPSPISGDMDYWGMVVKAGLVLAAVAEGGEILMTEDTYEAAVRYNKRLNQGTRGPKISEFRDVPLPGLRAPQAVYRITPHELRERSFSNLPTTAHRNRVRKSRWPTQPYGERKRLDAAAQIMKHMTTMYQAAVPQPMTEGLEGDGPPVGLVALVFTDIQSSTKLWEKSSEIMLTSIQLHNDIMRQTIARFNGYEVKTEGDAFMVSFSSVKNAVFFCCEAQRQLVNAPWPPGLLDKFDPLTDVQKAPSGQGVGGHLWRGLRMRMGIHVGCPTCLPDPVSGRMDYWGPMVNKSARISSVATGGQVVMSAGVYEPCKAELEKEAAQIRDLGAFELKGINGKTQIFEVLPSDLRARKFTDDKKPVEKELERKKSGRKKKGKDRGKHDSDAESKDSGKKGGDKGAGEKKKAQDSNLLTDRQHSNEGASNHSGDTDSQIPLSRHSSIASLAEDFIWAKSQYTDVEKMSHAAAINKLIVNGGLLSAPAPQSATSEIRSAAQGGGVGQAVSDAFLADLRRQMDDDASGEVRGMRSMDSIVERVQARERGGGGGGLRQDSAGFASTRRRASLPFGSGPYSPVRRRSLPGSVSVGESAPSTPKASGSGRGTSVPPSSIADDLSPLMAPGSARQSSLPPSVTPERETERQKERDATTSMLFQGIHRLESMHRKQTRRLTSLWRKAATRAPSSEGTATPEEFVLEPPKLDGYFKQELATMCERIERERMEQEDMYQKHASAHTTPGSGRLHPSTNPKRTQSNVREVVPKKKIDLFEDYVEVENGTEKNERLGFTLLHHQIARLNFKVGEVLKRTQDGPLNETDATEFAYQCLVCVNPRHAKMIKKNNAQQVRELLTATQQEVITGMEARVGVTKCRQSIIGMVLTWALALSGRTNHAAKVSPGTPVAFPVAATAAAPATEAKKDLGSMFAGAAKAVMTANAMSRSLGGDGRRHTIPMAPPVDVHGGIVAPSLPRVAYDGPAPPISPRPAQQHRRQSVEALAINMQASPRKHGFADLTVPSATDHALELGHPRTGSRDRGRRESSPGQSGNGTIRRRSKGAPSITSAGTRVRNILGSLSAR